MRTKKVFLFFMWTKKIMSKVTNPHNIFQEGINVGQVSFNIYELSKIITFFWTMRKDCYKLICFQVSRQFFFYFQNISGVKPLKITAQNFIPGQSFCSPFMKSPNVWNKRALVDGVHKKFCPKSKIFYFILSIINIMKKKLSAYSNENTGLTLIYFVPVF